MKTASDLIQTEIDGQNAMWGPDRDDNKHGEMVRAAAAQLVAITGVGFGVQRETAFATAKRDFYPANWNGFRDYGSTVANLVVAAAFLHNEIDRLIRAGADTTRTKRGEPYDERGDVPKRAFPE